MAPRDDPRTLLGIPFPVLSLAVAGLTYVLMVVGGYVKATDAGLACPDWPACHGALVPDFSIRGVPQEYTHRLLAAVTGVLVLLWVVEAWRVERGRPLIPRLTTAAILLLGGQILVGGLTVRRSLDPLVVTAHLALATAFFALTIVVTMLARQPRLAAAGAGERRAPGRDPSGAADSTEISVDALAADLLALTKPRIILLLNVTSATAFFMASAGIVDWALLGWTILGGTLVAAGAEALNSYLEREVDKQMVRTQRRPLPRGTIPSAWALAFGLFLIAVSSVVFVQFVNLLAAAFALAGAAFYVLVYTVVLKPRTVQNIVIGGAAGGFPALVGWAAATGSVGWPPVLLAALIVLWTPPHFWALALVYREDYKRAGFPMLPVVVGEARTVRHILAYSIAQVGFSFVFLFAGGTWGLAYLVTATILGAIFLWLAIRLATTPTPRVTAKHLFKFSGVYLLVLCIALAAEASVV